jgi:hypothetical protein
MAFIRHVAVASKDPVGTAEFYKKHFDLKELYRHASVPSGFSRSVPGNLTRIRSMSAAETGSGSASVACLGSFAHSPLRPHVPIEIDRPLIQQGRHSFAGSDPPVVRLQSVCPRF